MTWIGPLFLFHPVIYKSIFELLWFQRETCFCNEDECNGVGEEEESCKPSKFINFNWQIPNNVVNTGWDKIWGRATGKGINYAVCTGAWLPKELKESKKPKEPKEPKKPKKDEKLKCFDCVEAPKDHTEPIYERYSKDEIPRCFQNDADREFRKLDPKNVKENCHVCTLKSNGTGM